jgi:hypothetical protein
MPNSISEAQKTYDYTIGEDPSMYQEVVLSKTEAYLKSAADNFLKNNLNVIIKQRKINASGKLLGGYVEVVSPTQVQIILPYYFDFVNEGVRGTRSSRNAPNSPYSFKSPPKTPSGGEFRRSIKEYIENNQSKIKSVKRDVALGVGTESKGVSLIDMQTDTMMYLIRTYGIKTRNYFNDAVRQGFKDFTGNVAKAVKQDVILNLKVKRK